MNLKMKTLKVILSLILILVGVSVNCELMVFKNESALKSNSHASYEFYGSKNEITKNITEIAYNHGIAVYIAEYSDDLVGEYGYRIALINSEVGKPDIFLGKYNDLFFTKVEYVYIDISQIKKINDNTHLYFIGKKENIDSFNKDLSNIYKNINFDYNNDYSNSIEVIIFLVWLTIALQLFLITAYEVITSKKEIFIRMIYGDSVLKFILSNILIDAIIYMSVFFIASYLLLKITCISICLVYILKIIGIISAFNGILYLSFLRFDSRAVNKDRYSSKILMYNNSFKFISNIICIFSVIISLSVSEIAEGYIKVDSFVNEFKDYHLCEFYSSPQSDKHSLTDTASATEIINEKIYREHFEDLKPLLFTNTIIYKDFSEEITSFEIPNNLCCNYMLTNVYAYDYLCSQIPKFSDFKLTSDICILIPSFFSPEQKEEMIDTSLSIVENWYGEHFRFDYQIFEYNNDIRLPSINGMNLYRFRMNSNPAIIYNSVKANTINTPLYEVSNGNYIKNILYLLDDDSVEIIKKEYSKDIGIISSINLYDYYIQECLKFKSAAYLIYFIIIAFLFINLSTCITSIIINYKINSVELAIKKIHGFSIIGKNKNIILMDFISILSAALINLIIFLYNPDVFKYIIVFSLIIFIVHMICIIFQIQNSEKQNTNLIFKRSS